MVELVRVMCKIHRYHRQFSLFKHKEILGSSIVLAFSSGPLSFFTIIFVILSFTLIYYTYEGNV